MEEFLGSNYVVLTYSFEILAAVTGIFVYAKFKHTAAKYFIYFLVYVFLCELLSSYTFFVKEDGILNFLYGTVFEKNYWLGTLTWYIGSILFFSFYYFKILKNEYFRQIIKYLGCFYFFISILYISIDFQKYLESSLPIINLLGFGVILICTVLYFIEILQSEIILNFYRSLNFYISSAILIWWLIMTPLVFYDIYFKKADWDFVLLKWEIYLLANFFMYTTFTIGLIVSKPENLSNE